MPISFNKQFGVNPASIIIERTKFTNPAVAPGTDLVIQNKKGGCYRLSTNSDNQGKIYNDYKGCF